MIINWAHVDQDGRIVSWGSAAGTDIFLQPLPDGLTAVARPEGVTGFGGWVYLDGQWIQPDESNSPV